MAASYQSLFHGISLEATPVSSLRLDPHPLLQHMPLVSLRPTAESPYGNIISRNATWQRARASKQRAAPQRVASAERSVATADEEAAWRKRQEESKQADEEEGRMVGDSDHWRWTLNWSYVTPDLMIGSCPRSADDVDTIADEAKATAIVNLQSDICFDALQIPFPDIKQRSIERGVFLARVPIRDFDHGDQAAMLPEAVRVVNLLIHKGYRVYLHCTAGINRASLVALAYLYFVRGLRRDEALKMIKQSRPIVNPYLDCLTEAKRRLLEGRDEELTSLATEIYEQRCSGMCRGDASSDWSGAQSRALARSFSKYLEVDEGMINTERQILEHRWLQSGPPAIPADLQMEFANARASVAEQKSKIAELRALASAWEKEQAAAEAKVAKLEAALGNSLTGADVASIENGRANSGNTASSTNGRPVGSSNGGALPAATVAESDEESAGDHDDYECDVITRTCSEPSSE